MPEKPWIGKTVVVIDDSSQVRANLEAAFTAAGMKVVGSAKNGVEGVELVKQHRPEIASIDIIMPEMDGIECMKHIRAGYPETKCLFVTWLASEASIAETLSDYVPAYAFQPKPFTAADIEKRINMLYFPPQPQQQGIRNALDDTTSELLDLGIKVS
jgi:two-component system, chemotaxis family, chemotaxis protein CheY